MPSVQQLLVYPGDEVGGRGGTRGALTLSVELQNACRPCPVFHSFSVKGENPPKAIYYTNSNNDNADHRVSHYQPNHGQCLDVVNDGAAISGFLHV